MTSLLVKYNKSIQVKCIVKQGRRNWGGGGGGVRRGHVPHPPTIFSDLNVSVFKLHICEFSKPHSLTCPKLLTRTNIRFHSLESVKNQAKRFCLLS